MVKVISTPGPKAIYIEKLKLAVLYKLDNHEIFPRLRGLFSSKDKICHHIRFWYFLRICAKPLLNTPRADVSSKLEL